MDNNIIIIIAVMVLFIVAPRIIRATKQISSQKAKELIEDGATIVDVRQIGEYRSGHIKGAINIPLNNISKVSNRLSKDKHVIVYCQSGARSSSAYKQLKSMGYTNIYDLGGIGKWKFGTV